MNKPEHENENERMRRDHHERLSALSERYYRETRRCLSPAELVRMLVESRLNSLVDTMPLAEQLPSPPPLKMSRKRGLSAATPHKYNTLSVLTDDFLRTQIEEREEAATMARGLVELADYYGTPLYDHERRVVLGMKDAAQLEEAIKKTAEGNPLGVIELLANNEGDWESFIQSPGDTVTRMNIERARATGAAKGAARVAAAVLRVRGTSQLNLDDERGPLRAAARALLGLLHAREIPVWDEARERVLAETDAARLLRWLDKAVDTYSLDEVLNDKVHIRIRYEGNGSPGSTLTGQVDTLVKMLIQADAGTIHRRKAGAGAIDLYVLTRSPEHTREQARKIAKKLGLNLRTTIQIDNRKKADR